MLTEAEALLAYNKARSAGATREPFAVWYERLQVNNKIQSEAVFEAHLEGTDCGHRPCTTCAPIDIGDPTQVNRFDYQDLLAKYLIHVVTRIDNDFLEQEDREATSKYLEFTDAEWEELHRLVNLDD